MNSRTHRTGSIKALAVGSLAVAVFLVFILWAPWSRRGVHSEEELLLYCAAGISQPVDAVVADYQRQYGVKVRVEYDASGKLLAKIRAAGGRGELFLAGDPSYMVEARKWNLVAETIPVARIRPVLIVHQATQERLREEGRPVGGLDDLLRDDLSVVLANPEGASIGQLGRELLRTSGHWGDLERRMREHRQAKVSTVGTVNEVAQVVKLRPDHVGIVWDATAAQLTGVEVVHVEAFDEAVQEATVGVLASARGKRATAALQFARYLTARDKGQQRFAEFKFEPIPDADVWAEHPQIMFMSGAMLKPGIDETLKEFQAREGVTINTSYNGCGILVAQMQSIRAGGSSDRFPDAYFSCDVSFMSKVQHWFDPSETVSENDMVLIVKKGNPREIAALEDLARPELKVGLGHPENSALGALTDALLKRAGLYDRVYAEGWQDHIVHTDAGHDLVNKLRTGAIDLAVVYRSNAESTPENLEKYIDLVEIKAGDAVARQPFAIASESEHKYLMQRLYAALTADTTAERFRSIGFRWVHESKE